MIDIGVITYKGTMTGRAIAATIKTTDGRAVLTGGHAHQSTVNAMTGGTGVMRLGIVRDNGVAAGGMAGGAVAIHTDHRVVINRGMIIHKGAMADRAIIGGGAGSALFTGRRANQRPTGAVALTTGVMQLMVRA